MNLEHFLYIKCNSKRIAESCNIARSKARDYLSRAFEAGLSWTLPAELDDSLLEQMIFTVPSAPLENWHEQIGDPTVADVILDRLVHNAHKINLKGKSLRKNMRLDTEDQVMTNNQKLATLRSDSRVATSIGIAWHFPSESGGEISGIGKNLSHEIL